MNILFFSPRDCWPPTTGARLRDYYLARHLAARCRLTYVSLSQPGDVHPLQPPADSGFTRYLVLERDRGYTPSKLIRGFLGPLPVTILNYLSKRVAAELVSILRDGAFDAVQLESTHLMAYLPAIRAAKPGAVVLADWHNIESELMWQYANTTSGTARRIFAKRTARLIEHAERTLLAGCDVHTVASPREREKLVTVIPSANIHVIPNGVDVDYFSDTEIAHACRQSEDSAGERRDLVFVGSMDYHANIDSVQWFVREVWPAVRRAHPALSFVIVGRNPSPEVCALAGAGITVTGTVEDVRPYYASAIAVVAPLRIGSGTRLKILEALAAGVPVVATHLGAEGLNVEDGRNILLAGSAAEIAAAIDHLISTPDTRRRLIAAGRALAQTYDWSSLGAQLYRVHCEALDRQPMRP